MSLARLALALVVMGAVPRTALAAPPSEPETEWPLFDPYTSERESGMGVGWTELREISEQSGRRGLELELGGSRTTRRGAFFARIRQNFGFRALERSTYTLSPSAHTLFAGLAVPPFKFGTGLGLVPLGLSLSDGEPSLELFSPLCSLVLSVDLGGLTLGLRGYVEYLWRPLGRDDAYVRGLTLDVSLERRPPRPPPRFVRLGP